ncbi:MAG: penicillin-insensitive murein endopeptidase [Rhodoferax sp.]|nr:penicillin-insensitive murein endopeptidase [Rhodoferax sp.]
MSDTDQPPHEAAWSLWPRSRAAIVSRQAVRFALTGVLSCGSVLPAQATTPESRCYGTVSHGRIDGSVKLPGSGPNFTGYSTLGATAGRTHVHSKVAQTIVAAYAAVERIDPTLRYVYGETGWPSGGRFRPHRTHQNGLSVDFFVPVRNAQGQSVAVPTDVTNRLGYDLEFDQDGRYGEYRIDFPAMAEHLYQLHVAAKAQGIGIALVIFDAAYLRRLFATPRGPYLQQNLPFMKGRPWVRHDEHYHVDFAVRCASASDK